LEDEYRAIMEAVVARDVEQAVPLLNNHVNRTSEIVTAWDYRASIIGPTEM
jgi:DNA-binding GntR family transcriptional regulator